MVADLMVQHLLAGRIGPALVVGLMTQPSCAQARTASPSTTWTYIQTVAAKKKRHQCGGTQTTRTPSTRSSSNLPLSTTTYQMRIVNANAHLATTHNDHSARHNHHDPPLLLNTDNHRPLPQLCHELAAVTTLIKPSD